MGRRPEPRERPAGLLLINVTEGCAIVPGPACQTGNVTRLCRALAVGALLVTAGCSRGPQRGVAAFCEKIAKDKALLELPITSPEQVTAMVKRYREVDKLAPEEIRDQWHAITELIAKIASADVSPAKQEDLVNQIYATTKSINEAKKYTKDTCNVDFALPLVVTPTPVDGEPQPPSTTVVDPSATTVS